MSTWLRNWFFATNSNIQTPISLKPLIFQAQNILSNRIHSLKYLGSTTFGFKDIVIRKSEFVAKTQFLNFCLENLEEPRECLKLRFKNSNLSRLTSLVYRQIKYIFIISTLLDQQLIKFQITFKLKRVFVFFNELLIIFSMNY